MERKPLVMPYELLGGADGIRQLVKAFYDRVETDPAARPLLQQHLDNSGMAQVREEQFKFLSGFLGGPQLYLEHHGHANVKQMHAHLAVTAVERDAWLACMDLALKDVGASPETHAHMMAVFTRVANALRNA